MTRHDIQSLLSILTNHIDAYILTDAFYLITSNGQTDYLLVSDVFLAESWILLAKKNTLSEQFPNPEDTACAKTVECFKEALPTCY
jgi:hypothetical protein